MADSLFFKLHMVGQGTFTGLQREMLSMTLAANPGVTLGAAVKDVFEFLEAELDEGRLEAICARLVRENAEREEAPAPTLVEDPDNPEGVKPVEKAKSTFGDQLIKWIQEMHASERLLVAVGYDVSLAEFIYTQQDYLVTDHICTLFLQDRWQSARVHLEAAAAPWGGSGSGAKHNGPVEHYDMTQAHEDDPQWKELAACFGG